MKVLYNNGTRPVSVAGIVIQPNSEYTIDDTFLTNEMISSICALADANMIEVTNVRKIKPTPVVDELPQDEIVEQIEEQIVEPVEVVEEVIEQPAEEVVKKTTKKTTTKKKTTK